MKYDVVIAGLDVAEVLAMSRLIARAASRAGLVHTLSESPSGKTPGGHVAHLRMADHPIEAPGIAPESADLILGTEPLESLHQMAFLAPTGSLVTSSDAKVHDSYPPTDDVLWSILSLRSGFLVDTARLVREHGCARECSTLMIGAVADFLPVDPGDLRAAIIDLYADSGTELVERHLSAFDAGHDSLRHREIVDEFTTLTDPRA